MTEVQGFTKARLLGSEQFMPIQKDILTALLDDDKLYSVDDAKRKIEQYLKKEAR
ncbi:hypothetical protein [Paenibacillus sp. L3-i20]|uniref:hypothetical protein n=1 Tax=Paenibacillus sp. L3-i20 TaxID=2905833 RepID=UPI001EE10983|nr:hypothetical protein [Paenibacillus sp. L3-i20]GKU79859.1 hypothetical protein L3i20_v242560 [Paenibacillus sp. L3-i20]